MVLELKYFDNKDFLNGLLEMTDQELWEVAKLNLDDWDYGVVFDGHLKSLSSYFQITQIERLLSGVCNNEWYEVKSKSGENYTIGMAYHA